MGELVGNLANVAAFQNQIFPNGIDLGRSIYQNDIGILEADPNATFRAGMLVDRNVTNGLIAASTSQSFFGVAKWNKASSLYSTLVDQPFTAPSTLPGTFNLTYAPVPGTGPTDYAVSVNSAPNGTGVQYVQNTDYTVNATNGIITVTSGHGITAGQALFVTFSFQLSQLQLQQFQGLNFWNFTDDVTIQDGRITIITNWSVIFTTQYDASQLYTLTGLTSNLYAAGVVNTANQGLFTSSATDGGAFVGRVFQVPSAGDPYLGVTFGGSPVQAISGTLTGGSGQVTA